MTALFAVVLLLGLYSLFTVGILIHQRSLYGKLEKKYGLIVSHNDKVFSESTLGAESIELYKAEGTVKGHRVLVKDCFEKGPAMNFFGLPVWIELLLSRGVRFYGPYVRSILVIDGVETKWRFNLMPTYFEIKSKLDSLS